MPPHRDDRSGVGRVLPGLAVLLDYRRAQVDFERVQEIPAGGGTGITSIQGGGGQAPRANAGGGGGFGN